MVAGSSKVVQPSHTRQRQGHVDGRVAVGGEKDAPIVSLEVMEFYIEGFLNPKPCPLRLLSGGWGGVSQCLNGEPRRLNNSLVITLGGGEPGREIVGREEPPVLGALGIIKIFQQGIEPLGVRSGRPRARIMRFAGG